jgi:uncharacterized protein (TIGR01777 family)
MTSILITGGSGFIGRHFCQAAHQLGWQITVLSRNPEAATQLMPDNVQLISSLDQIESEQRIDVLLNLAGEPLANGRWTQSRKAFFVSSRIDITKALYQFFAAREQRPGTVISGSAVGYYGAGNGGDMEIDESLAGLTGIEDSFSHNLCSQWEEAAAQFEQLGSRVCFLRTGIVLGEGGALSKMLPAFKLGLGGRMGNGRQWMSWIHVEDMVSLIMHCISDATVSGPVNGTAPNPVTNQQFSRALGTALSRPAFFPMPAFVIKTLFGEMGEELLLQGKKVVPRKLQDSGFNFQYPLLPDALNSLV